MTEQEIYQIFDTWLHDRLLSNAAIKKLKKAFIMPKPTTDSKYDLLIKKTVKVAKSTDTQWQDMTSRELIKAIGLTPRTGFCINIGKALNKAGAIHRFNKGVSTYRIKKYRVVHPYLAKHFNIL